MPTYAGERRLPYSAEDVFDVVSDVESYPRFLPGWRTAQILERSKDTLRVAQTVAVPPFRWRFVSEAVLERPERLDIGTSGGPFRYLHIEWRFTRQGEAACVAGLTVRYAMRSRVVEKATGALLRDLPRRTLSAFEQRLARLKGHPAHPLRS
ncbi:MAG: type II toxin-antitoxin system RatA family toxin [Gammaproteobacteria bacterium]|nr:type II toxin-antitoxin system RatA family toxin [Gammaproteobacteria bacterium]NIR85649.1 type II toxin-antitoxin system RatA family toxin [Gammaproteobacteria bacterium]NIR90137.1 type II toxin-antitoxin system RatA family toxin [Gammaproteobacteria bacterium]NIU06783.1 type II toxin-antitoxin system RatA family toxin [Gammaproteobacteria bacterium]NIV53716.1 hypothetical protein [Gammaproteobacteria bacterium]